MSALPSFPDIGSLVEVTTKEEGFEGVSFVATVVGALRADGKRQTLRVKYHTLLASENGTEPLIEDVEIRYVRPQPPAEEDALMDLSPGDVVDVFNKDGWWTGTVTARVIGPGKRRYTVKFEDQTGSGDFVVAKIRMHWDWELASQIWSRPAKQVELESLSQVGRKIEASFTEQRPHCSWFEASVLECLSDGSILVEYSTIKDASGQPLKKTVELLDVRPRPPSIKVEKFLLSDEIDVYYEIGWWTGVITKVLEGGRYAVSFVPREKVVCDSDLRPHLQWKYGKWLAFTRGVTLSEAPVPCSKRKRGRPSKMQQLNVTPLPILKTEVLPGTQPSSAKRGKKPHRVEESTSTPGPRSKPWELALLEVAKQVPEPPCNEIVEQAVPELIEGKSPATNATRSTETGQKTPKSCLAMESSVKRGVLEWLQQQPQFPQPEELGKKIPRQTAETIGLMVCFQSLVQTILDNPKTFKSDVLDALPQYAKVGLDVSVLQDSVAKLLEMRSKQVYVDDEAKVIDNEILMHTDEKCRIDREISETNNEMQKLQEQMNMLQDKVSCANMAKETKEGEISALQAKLQETRETIDNMDDQMHGVAYSLWNHYFS